MVGLLVRAMQQGNVDAVQQLCKLRAADELDRHCVRGLLRWARVLGSRPGRDAVVGALCSLRQQQQQTGLPGSWAHAQRCMMRGQAPMRCATGAIEQKVL
uniref:Uncharacterized protein n=1 Tax=Tetradesmus obliquus TaxID=3088 RepID=A0A383V5E0_TETOB|eukprot:jgi/Sobl393_1/14308/SZX60173.1